MATLMISCADDQAEPGETSESEVSAATESTATTSTETTATTTTRHAQRGDRPAATTPAPTAAPVPALIALARATTLPSPIFMALHLTLRRTVSIEVLSGET